MPPTLDDLVPEFRPGAERLIQECAALGVVMRVNETVRDPLAQARIWRQSRTVEQIRDTVARLRRDNAPFLADCVEVVGPQHGAPVTNAPPGLSWHQWGEALDCFWVVDGKAVWSTTRKVNGRNGYHTYAEAARHLGLEAGGFWTSFKDWPHVQSRAASSPAKVYTIVQIDTVMRQRFGHLL